MIAANHLLTPGGIRPPPTTMLRSAPVLIVDDTPSKRLAMKAALAPLGHRIVEADSGVAALRCVMEEDFAVILLDVTMPGMDGFETATLIRERWQSELTPIIFVTAFSSNEVGQIDHYAGDAVDFLFAPVPPVELRSKVSFFAHVFLNAQNLAARSRDVQETADQLRSLTDAAPIGIFQTDADNRYVYSNSRWSEITGIAADEAAGQHWDVILRADQRDALRAERAADATGTDLCHRFEVGLPGSECQTVLVTSKAMHDSDGVLTGWVGTLADISAEVGAKSAMADAMDAAVEASQMKSDFLATMSHEIRTPMNAVIGMSGLMMDTDLDDEQKRYASGIRTGGELLMTLINDILDFSKIEAGKLELEDVDFDLEGLVEEVADLFAESARTRNIMIYSCLQPDVPRWGRADAGRLRQVLVNFVNNAVKFTHEGQIVVRVRQSIDESDGTTLRFEVVDSGIGMSSDQQQRAFEAFTQADASSTRQYGGTGLGLAICRQLVELMGGEIGIESAPGEGSTFWFTVAVRAPATERDERWIRPLEDIRVLVVDDDLTSCEIVERQIEAWGMRPVTTSSADGALALLEDAADDPFHVALLDFSIPDANGLELARRISDAERFGDVRMALLSSVDTTLSDRRSAGVDGHLRKPVRQSQLYDMLMSLLKADGSSVPTDPAKSGQLGTTAGTGRVLLVEDNPANQLVGARMVEKLGHRVDVVADGREALESLRIGAYDLVFMDCQMPVMDGYQATRRLRERERTTGSRTPVIAMTAGVTVADRQHCIEAGMDDFVPKPVRRDAVAETLHRWMAIPWPAAEEADGSPSDEPAGDEDLDPAVIDPERWAMILDLVDGDPAVLHELVHSFVTDVPVQLEKLRGAVNANDLETARTTSHRIKGSAMNLGATALGDLAYRIERDSRGELGSADPLADEVAREFERVAAELDRLERSQGAPITTR